VKKKETPVPNRASVWSLLTRGRDERSKEGIEGLSSLHEVRERGEWGSVWKFEI